MVRMPDSLLRKHIKMRDMLALTRIKFFHRHVSFLLL
jgi:hypothetical protein